MVRDPEIIQGLLMIYLDSPEIPRIIEAEYTRDPGYNRGNMVTLEALRIRTNTVCASF